MAILVVKDCGLRPAAAAPHVTCVFADEVPASRSCCAQQVGPSPCQASVSGEGLEAANSVPMVGFVREIRACRCKEFAVSSGLSKLTAAARDSCRSEQTEGGLEPVCKPQARL